MKKTGKIVTWIVTAGMLLSLVSCGQNSADHPGLQSLGADILNGDDSMQATGAGGAVASTGTQGTDAGMTKDGGTARHTDASGGGLYLLASQKQQSVCYTQDGYYYLPGQPESLSDGSYGSRLTLPPCRRCTCAAMQAVTTIPRTVRPCVCMMSSSRLPHCSLCTRMHSGYCPGKERITACMWTVRRVFPWGQR